MSTRLLAIGRLLNFAIVFWILAAIFWGVLAGKHKIETPLIAIWLFLGVALARLIIWAISSVARRL
jgi:hypothetical protein